MQSAENIILKHRIVGRDNKGWVRFEPQPFDHCHCTPQRHCFDYIPKSRISRKNPRAAGCVATPLVKLVSTRRHATVDAETVHAGDVFLQ